MSARHFARVAGETITVSIGAGGFAFGPGTFACVMRRTSDLDDPGIFIAGAASAWVVFFDVTTDQISFFNGTATDTSTPSLLTADGWCLIAVTKATGSVVTRAHKFSYTTGAWTHTNGSTALANSGVPATSSVIGDGNSKLAGDIQAIGIWNTVLSDANIEALRYDVSLANWGSFPTLKSMWLLNQEVVTTTVTDLTGGGANETARSGTTVVTDSPNLNFTVPLQPRRMPLGV